MAKLRLIPKGIARSADHVTRSDQHDRHADQCDPRGNDGIQCDPKRDNGIQCDLRGDNGIQYNPRRDDRRRWSIIVWLGSLEF